MLNKLKFQDKMAYGAATIADAIPYNFRSIFLLLFLTDIAEITPDVAGTLLMIASIFSAFFGVVIGYLSDSIHTKWGRRRPYLVISVLPLCIGMVCLFTTIEGTIITKMIFYLSALIFLNIGSGLFFMPYTALGAELTDDYDERARLRTYARGFGIAGNTVAATMPLMIVAYLEKNGFTEMEAWQCVALLMATLSGASILITWRATRGREKLVVEAGEKRSLRPSAIIKDYTEIIRLKPCRSLLVPMIGFNLGSTILYSVMIYFMKYNLEIADAMISKVFLVSMIASAAFTPIIFTIAEKFEKQKALLIFLLISGLGLTLFRWIGVSSYGGALVCVCFFTLGYASFWQLIYSLLYDIGEVDELVHGKRREGSIISVSSIIINLASAAAMQVLGLVLKLSGYEAEAGVQGALTLSAIENMFTLVPGILLIISSLSLFLYPLNRKRFDLLKNALKLKKENKEYSIEGIEKIF